MAKITNRADREGPDLIDPESLADELTRLTGIAVLICQDRSLAEDLASEAIARVLRRRNSEPIAELRPYLRRTLVNLLTRTRRREQLELAALTKVGRRTAPTAIDDVVSARSVVSQALRMLPHDQRVVVSLRYFDDLTAAQVAEVLKVPVGTVESRLSRALATMRTVLRGGETG